MLADATQRRDDHTFDVAGIEEALEATETGFARIAWADLGVEGEARLASDAVTVRCLQDAAGGVPSDPDAPGVTAIVARAY